MRDETVKQILNEVEYRYSRSSGPGGQHVNRTESRVEVIWAPDQSQAFLLEEKSLLLEKLAPRLNKSGQLQLTCDEYRSRTQNVDVVTAKLLSLINAALRPTKKRKATKPTRAAQRKRVDSKKRRGEIKKSRVKFRY
ncbi:MAG: aminoacyl-tRNA hydrolase [Bdellovibrionales bacterium]|nr:aminoacyl-tRNA hydrolase [Bdellovibrionales bacterium]